MGLRRECVEPLQGSDSWGGVVRDTQHPGCAGATLGFGVKSLRDEETQQGMTDHGQTQNDDPEGRPG